MTNHDAQPGADIAPAVITNADLMERYGDRWDIRRQLSLGVLSAEQRSPDGLHIRFICALTVAELAAKIEHAETDTP